MTQKEINQRQVLLTRKSTFLTYLVRLVEIVCMEIEEEANVIGEFKGPFKAIVLQLIKNARKIVKMGQSPQDAKTEEDLVTKSAMNLRNILYPTIGLMNKNKEKAEKLISPREAMLIEQLDDMIDELHRDRKNGYAEERLEGKAAATVNFILNMQKKYPDIKVPYDEYKGKIRDIMGTSK